MPSEVILPRVDMDMTTGRIAKWLVPSGAAVTRGQPLFEIETDKATMEIEAEADGTIRDLVDAGASDIPVGSVVAWIDRAGETAPSSGAAPPPRPGDARMPDADSRLPGSPPSSMPADGQAKPKSAVLRPDETGRPRATPLARRLARERAIDLSSLVGSGPRGRIQAADFERHMAAQAPRAAVRPAMTSETGSPPTPWQPIPAVVASAAAGPLHLVRLREGQGTPVVLIHGFGADTNGWRPALASLGVSCPLLSLDLPGHGQSVLEAGATFASMVDTVEEALLTAGLHDVALVGHSLGGAIATAVAARGAVEVRRLVLLSPAGLGPDINGAFLQGFLEAQSEASLTPWMHELVADPAAITPAFVRATLKARAGTGLVEMQRQVAAALFPDGTQTFSTRAELARLVLPTRVVFGTADRIIPARHADALPPLVALHRLPGVGHMPHYEARELVGAILRADLAA
jgi:pimeloyl-ACP methyl ester carboxylesterase